MSPCASLVTTCSWWRFLSRVGAGRHNDASIVCLERIGDVPKGHPTLIRGLALSHLQAMTVPKRGPIGA